MKGVGSRDASRVTISVSSSWKMSLIELVFFWDTGKSTHRSVVKVRIL